MPYATPIRPSSDGGDTPDSTMALPENPKPGHSHSHSHSRVSFELMFTNNLAIKAKLGTTHEPVHSFGLCHTRFRHTITRQDVCNYHWLGCTISYDSAEMSIGRWVW